ncbi:MAG: hypothetical protein IM650_03340 [Phenylobacterium sp.]|uniref:hypothetical protein n=1 Tax=Phenylobacterium sp. TaxID=1871053 RepID=UPI0025EB2BC7|nr:hypothetical protein [Phenylobacterium sp.]MCA6248938.1 hypothetical protein [Phenylobacterium sp.]MCA6251436.1 hypothetical protein [Phenylobacterium sp.]MCA6257120.1 hypothetical protein [Phenylobacterium sp.]MCA6263014.1 hypothetical protein [Phenylobacterium sp.]MCA6265938.1 hypothetical protein [Phenylobacterium sp.]
MVHLPPANEKPVHWIGSSKSDLLALPQEVVSERLKRAREHYESNYQQPTKGKAGKRGK